MMVWSQLSDLYAYFDIEPPVDLPAAPVLLAQPLLDGSGVEVWLGPSRVHYHLARDGALTRIEHSGERHPPARLPRALADLVRRLAEAAARPEKTRAAPR